MREHDVHEIGAVVEPVPQITRPRLDRPDRYQSGPLEIRMLVHRRRLAGAEIRPDQSGEFRRWIRRDFGRLCERFAFVRLEDALTSAVVRPAVVQATDGIVDNVPSMEPRLPVGATARYEMRVSGGATIDGEVFVHDAHRLGAPGRQIFRPNNRLPKQPQIPSGKRSWAGANEIVDGDLHLRCYPFAGSSKKSTSRGSPRAVVPSG